jgi:hypothetical protein
MTADGSQAASTLPAGTSAPASGNLDEMMLAMDVVDTLRHREDLVARELNEDAREEQLIERLRALYKSQGIDVPDHIIAEGVKGLKESRFGYTPPKPGIGRTLALLWVRRATYGKWAAASLAALIAAIGLYQFGVVRPREQAAQTARIELADTLPRQLGAAYQAVTAEAQVPDARQRADAIRAQAQSALDRGNAAEARAGVSELDQLATALRQDYTLRIAGRPEDETGFYREHPSFQGRAYFVVVDAIDPAGKPVMLPIRNDETNQVETVSRFAVRVPIATFNAVRNDKSANGIVQSARLAEKRRGYLEPEYTMPVLDGRITRW